MRTLQQDLTFEKAEAVFKRYKVEFSEEKFITLGLRNIHDDQYTNLALLISDQCQHTIKIAVFGDAENITFKDAKEFGGSVFQQLDESYDYLALCNRTVSTFRGLERIDKQDYPEEAIREALLNAIVHKDYSFSGSIIINVNDACMEFISIGGLLPGLSAEDIRSGISQPRNRKLAEIFHRLRLIESYGTGIRKIYALYKNCSVQPRIEVTPNTFKLVLPNMNAFAATEEQHKADVKSTSPAVTPQWNSLYGTSNTSKITSSGFKSPSSGRNIETSRSLPYKMLTSPLESNPSSGLLRDATIILISPGQCSEPDTVSYKMRSHSRGPSHSPPQILSHTAGLRFVAEPRRSSFANHQAFWHTSPRRERPAVCLGDK